MTTVTLEQITTRQDELAKLIQQFTAQQPRQITIDETTITLAQGEHYAGIVLAEDGSPRHHLVLLPGEAENLTFEQAHEWAVEQNGFLPTPQDQALLFANLKSHFKAEYYWSGREHETESSWAWSQTFSYGTQGTTHEGCELRARAVRRLVIE